MSSTMNGSPKPSSSRGRAQQAAAAPVQPLFSTHAPLHQPPSILPLPPNLRQSLKRRRSSYPPAGAGVTTPGGLFFSSFIGGTPLPGYDALPAVPGISVSSAEKKDDAAVTTSWESLLNLDGKFTPASPRDNPLSPSLATRKMGGSLLPEAGPSSRPFLGNLPPSLSPSRIAQIGQDLAWKTILASMVEVEGVGEVGVAKLLHEVWKRGGGDLVTNQCLWPSIIVSLSLSSADGYQPDHRIPTPSAHAALALQQLYNLTLRHWEPSIFTGLLAQFASINNTPPPPFPSNETPVYGAATPTKEFDMSQWTNLTPGFDWSTILNGIGPAANADPFDPREDLVGDHRRNSLRQEEDQARGIDELLAAMEEGRELHEREAQALLQSQSQAQAPTTGVPEPKTVSISLPVSPSHTPVQPIASKNKAATTATTAAENYLPTPETDASESPANYTTRQNSFTAASDQGASPHVTACSYKSAASSALSTVSKALSVGSGNGATGSSRAAHPTSLAMPVNSFVPPPPMCMFFNPSFKDITQGKLGVWKGELEVKGQSGGKFSILVIGEQGTESIWQATTWGDEISYPPPAMPQPSSTFTSTMTPVSHLAREGYVPAAMAMVLCNDPDVQSFCSMVQGLHQEGVAFHLPNPRKLPLMFLPAKFDSNDGLQRLGLAYMTKAGGPPVIAPPIPSDKTTTTGNTTTAEPAKKRKRRQSAPAQAAFKGAASRVIGEETGAGGTGGRAKKRMSLGLAKVDEDAEKA